MIDGLFKFPRPPATDADICQLMKSFDLDFPSSYLDFLKTMNGGEWCISHEEASSLVLWSCKEVYELTDAYNVAEFASGLILIGSDGGGEAVAFDTRKSTDPNKWPVVLVPFGDLDFDSCIEQGHNFNVWLTAGFPLTFE